MQSYPKVKIDKPLVCGILFFMKQSDIIIGNRYGFLTVIEEIEPIVYSNGSKRRFWKVKCDCGVIMNRNIKALCVNSNCGCKKSITHGTHHKTDSRIYTIWVNMKQRCTNPNVPAYKRYGAKGVSVCERWLNSFEDFYNDVIEGYSEELTLDRYPNKKGNYEPTNFRWATYEQQANNKDDNILFEYNGEQLTLTEIGRRIGVDYRKIWRRIKNGMKPEDAIKLCNNYKEKEPITGTLKEKCEKLGVNYNAVKIRKSRFKLCEDDAINFYIK